MIPDSRHTFLEPKWGAGGPVLCNYPARLTEGRPLRPKALWEEIRVGGDQLQPQPMARSTCSNKSLSVRSEILFYKRVIRLKYEFFYCAVSLAVGFPASPQAKASILRVNLSQIHGLSILRTAYLRRFGSFALVAVFYPEVPSPACITDEATGKWTRERQGIGGERISALFKLNGLHLNVMFVTKGA